MKLQSILYTLLTTGILLVSCTKKDNFDGTVAVFDPPVLSDETPAKAKVKEIYEKYGVLFKPEFSLVEYTYDWNNRVAQTDGATAGLRYTPADEAYVVPVIDSVESWVFKVLGEDFSKEYMPLNILLTDTMENKQLSGASVVHRMYEGYIATNYILLSYVSERFDDNKDNRLLRESWLSLFIEKILPRLPAPTAFAAVSKAGYAKASFTAAEDVMVNYALLKKGRTKQISGSALASAWARVTVGQDFGDFVAFIVFTPEDEKQIAYSKNPAILTKVNLVKEYFQTHFNITLPYLPTLP